jgi:threonine dehydratase
VSGWPIRFEDVLAARERLRPFLDPTPLRSHPGLDGAAGRGIRVRAKHENLQPTRSFKVRNAVAAVTALGAEERGLGIVAATRGNHGQGLAWAGRRLGVPVTICVPRGNSPLKNAAMRDLGAELVETGDDYDEAAAAADRLVRERGLALVHSTNNASVIAGAGTLALEMLEEAPDLEALVVAVGGGSQAVGALTVARAIRPGLRVYGVQAERASAIHDSWHAGVPFSRPSADTFADGLATRQTYALTFPALREGLAGFVAAGEREIADALRLIRRATGEEVEGAGAAGLAGLLKLRGEFEGRAVGIVLSGGNIDAETLRRVLDGEI